MATIYMCLNKTKNLFFSAIISIIFSALGINLCNISLAHSANSSHSKEFAFRISGEPETLDWNRAHTPIETYLLMNLMEGLVAFDANLKIIPCLASSWTISDDGRTYVFKLRPDVKWSDGVAMKAEDFVFSWKRLLSPLTAAPYAYFLFDIEGAEWFNKGTIQDFNSVGIKALDPLTLQVKLVRPVAHWIYIPTFWVTFPLRGDLIQKFGDSPILTSGTQWTSPGRMVTLGPYTLESHDIDSKIVLKANPYYYGTHGNVDRVIARVVTDDSVALNLYDTGKLDFLTDVSSIDLKRILSQKRADLKYYPYLKTGYLGFVTSKYPFTNPHVRGAIAMAIDKSKIGDLLQGGQKGASSFVPPGMLGYSKSLGLPFDPSRAKVEMRISGVDLSTVTMNLLIPNTDKTLVLGQFIQSELKNNLGLNVVLQPFDNKTFRANMDLKQYPTFMVSWNADFPDPDNYASVFLKDSGNNRTTWKNGHYDELVQSARTIVAKTAKEKNARESQYFDLQKILLEKDIVIVPLYYDNNIALIKTRAKGVVLNGLNYLYLKNVVINN